MNRDNYDGSEKASLKSAAKRTPLGAGPEYRICETGKLVSLVDLKEICLRRQGYARQREGQTGQGTRS